MAELLGSTLLECPTVRSLEVASGTQLGHMAKILPSCTSLTTLNLSNHQDNHQDNPQDGKSFAAALAQCPNLRNLRVPRNCLRAQLTALPPGLLTLDLSDNYLR